jgi:hypothetical protein
VNTIRSTPTARAAALTFPAAAGLQLIIQTAPALTELFFVALVSLTPSTGVNGSRKLKESLSANEAPMARWVRWQLSSSNAWDITFRAFLSVA